MEFDFCTNCNVASSKIQFEASMFNLNSRDVLVFGLIDGDWCVAGLVYKLRNHRLAFGYTDAVQLSGDYLLASSFYLDTGKGSINS